MNEVNIEGPYHPPGPHHTSSWLLPHLRAQAQAVSFGQLSLQLPSKQDHVRQLGLRGLMRTLSVTSTRVLGRLSSCLKSSWQSFGQVSRERCVLGHCPMETRNQVNSTLGCCGAWRTLASTFGKSVDGRFARYPAGWVVACCPMESRQSLTQ